MRVMSTHLASRQQLAQDRSFGRGHLDSRGCGCGYRDNLFVSCVRLLVTYNRKELSCKRGILDCGSNQSGVMVESNDIQVVAPSLLISFR